MPPNRGPIKCTQCNSGTSLMWYQINENQQICNDCYENNRNNLKDELEPGTMPNLAVSTALVTQKNNEKKTTRLRKSTRTTRYKSKSSAGAMAQSVGVNGGANGGGPPGTQSKSGGQKSGSRGRRGLTRRAPLKAPSMSATTSFVKSLFYKGFYYQIGDIVSLCNSNYDVFYAQIRGLIMDSFCEKSAVITWLIPTRMSPPPNKGFDPSTYLIGPTEDLPRLLSCMEFVMHAPSDYYHDRTTPYPPTEGNVLSTFKSTQGGKGGGFLWTNLYPYTEQAG